VRPRPAVCSDGAYRIEDGALPAGSTLGGSALTVKLLANGSIDTVFSTESGSNIVRDVDVHHFDSATGLRLTRGGGRFTLRPECQTHEYRLRDGVEVEKSTFAVRGSSQPAICYIAFCARNHTREPFSIDSIAVARIKSSFEDRIDARWDEPRRALVVWSDRGANARAIVASDTPASWEVTGDHARMLANRWPGAFGNEIDVCAADPLAVLHVRTTIGPGATAEFWFAIAALAGGSDGSDDVLREYPPAPAALASTRTCYEKLLAKSVVRSPGGEVDLGVHWAKANMIRVMSEGPASRGFTNDPGGSTHCVARDAAWFVYGCDWIDPAFSEALLRGFAERQERDGKIVEYFDLRTGETNDDGLNVNDDTPLYALAVAHHALAGGSGTFLAEFYPSARRAVEQLLANRDERGLVYCAAGGTGARGIVGWRNVIPDFRLSGATTELNSEAFAALKKMSVLARMLGEDRDVERYEREAESLRVSVERHLRNPENGFYYLALDVDGRPRSALSSDLLFPIIFGISDDATSARILQRLREADFWTEAGIRTVPRDAPEYGPSRGSGLLGGVWAGVTFWYAFAAARFAPEIMVEALEQTFAHYARDPSATNTVPGEFSEWLHGETLVNGGMMLSPWFPPRYLWAAIEGACGLEPAAHGARVTPRLPPEWSWLSACDVPFQGKPISWFAVRMDELRLFTTQSVESDLVVDVYERDVTADVSVEGEENAVVAFARAGCVLVFIGNRARHTVSVAIRSRGVLSALVPVRRYESTCGTWNEDAGAGSDAYTTMIGSRGFALVEFGKPEGD
jgi:hypothetical protein